MKISHNWLKQFIAVEQSPEEISKILTNIGLEVELVEPFETIKGGLEGVVVGKVLTCEKHPNADKLSVTTVNIGQSEPLKIVCGAPNVAAGQTVLVATIGTKLYDGDKEFEIKKSHIRGEDSFGMICAEDELGLGTSHAGIMVLPDSLEAGTLAKDYFCIESDLTYEIGLTPNRVDAASHLGVARDLSAYLSQKTPIGILLPKVCDCKNSTKQSTLTVTVNDPERCPRYAGIVIEGVKIARSPDWLQNRLKAIGLKPINNIVDITNYILHELGQPLHAFDLSKVGNKVIVGTLPDKTKFKTLDGIERELSSEDLMICNEQGGMCIAGVFGGLESGVKETTTSIFLESAYFNPMSIRKSARRHQLSTDASFRFERGIDPNITIFALKRAVGLILEMAGGSITSEIFDTKPEGFPSFNVEVPYTKVDSLIGQKIDHDIIKKILVGLGIIIEKEANGILYLQVPPFKVDVQRPEDVVEEILRVYGYNSIAIPSILNSSITFEDGSDDTKQRNLVSNMLSANGFNEIMCNSITKADYFEHDGFNKDSLVRILNPLSSDLNVMRASLLFGMLETIVHNSNRQSDNLKLYEFGRVYSFNSQEKDIKKYTENRCMSIAVTGNKTLKAWNAIETEADFYFLKSYVENVLLRIGIKSGNCKQEPFNSNELQGLQYIIGRSVLVEMGAVKHDVLSRFGIEGMVYFATIHWDNALLISGKPAKFKELPKYFEVKRDLSMLIDSSVTFEQIKKLAHETERNYLKDVTVFDVYQGKGIPEGKKSYAVSFILQDESATMKDGKIEGIMNNLIRVYKSKLGVELR